MKNINKKMLNDNFSSYVLGVDIGGTNINVGVAGIKNTKPFLLFSLNYKSKNLDSVVPAINNSLTHAKNNYEIDIDFACIGAAGVVSPFNDSAQLTNVKWNVSSKEIINKTSLKTVYIINDFQAIGYSINLLDHDNTDDIYNVRTVRNENKSSSATKAIIGAGTGLGKSILIYDNNFKAYVPIPSEGGHSDFPVQNFFEIELVRFIKQLRGISNPLSYEEVISGRGIEGIYLFLRKTKKYSDTKYIKEIDSADEKAPLISKYKNLDDTCRDTFRLFAQYYARCAKNYALETLPSGGLYIAGGIAAKNKEIFSSNDFIHEFENAYRRADLLKTIPIYVILNYDVSLYGTCYAAMYYLSKNKQSI